MGFLSKVRKGVKAAVTGGAKRAKGVEPTWVGSGPDPRTVSKPMPKQPGPAAKRPTGGTGASRASGVRTVIHNEQPTRLGPTGTARPTAKPKPSQAAGRFNHNAGKVGKPTRHR